jgi:DNA helicase-4
MCKSCHSPVQIKSTFAQCLNEKCKIQRPLCEECGREMQKRQNKHREFLRCSGIALKERSCKDTRQIKG